MYTIKGANQITGGLSNPSKMPGFGYGLPSAGAPWVPAIAKQLGIPVPSVYGCKAGAKLAQVEGTVCSKCYATRGHYTFTKTRAAQVRRLHSILVAKFKGYGDWAQAMAFLIKRSNEAFRWHDSGDILGLWHLDMISMVCSLTPSILHYLPTKEAKMLDSINSKNLPDNLIIRLSASKIDGQPPKSWPLTSTVQKVGEVYGMECPASQQGNKCLDCRACWSKTVKNISYNYH